MKALLAIMFCVIASAATAADNETAGREWQTYREFLAEPMCGVAKDTKVCIAALDKWRRDFSWATDPHWNEQLVGRRNIATCLFTGCDGEVKRQRILACAWMRVVVKSGDPKINADDLANEKTACGSLSEVESTAASGQADRILKLFP